MVVRIGASLCALVIASAGPSDDMVCDASLIQQVQIRDNQADSGRACDAQYLPAAGASVADVKKALADECQPYYCAGGEGCAFCDSIMTVLFAGSRDKEEPFDESDCEQVLGLVEEHWMHQAALQRKAALVQRAAKPEREQESGTVLKLTLPETAHARGARQVAKLEQEQESGTVLQDEVLDLAVSGKKGIHPKVWEGGIW